MPSFLLRFSLPRLGNSPSLPAETVSSHLDPEGCFSLWMPLLPHLGWLLWCGQPPHVLKALTLHTRLPLCWTCSSLGWTQVTLLREALTRGPSLFPGLGPGLEHHSFLPFWYKCLSSVSHLKDLGLNYSAKNKQARGGGGKRGEEEEERNMWGKK